MIKAYFLSERNYLSSVLLHFEKFLQLNQYFNLISVECKAITIRIPNFERYQDFKYLNSDFYRSVLSS